MALDRRKRARTVALAHGAEQRAVGEEVRHLDAGGALITPGAALLCSGNLDIGQVRAQERTTMYRSSFSQSTFRANTVFMHSMVAAVNGSRQSSRSPGLMPPPALRATRSPPARVEDRRFWLVSALRTHTQIAIQTRFTVENAVYGRLNFPGGPGPSAARAASPGSGRGRRAATADGRAAGRQTHRGPPTATRRRQRCAIAVKTAAHATKRGKCCVQRMLHLVQR
jgi:hypothetical protein